MAVSKRGKNKTAVAKAKKGAARTTSRPPGRPAAGEEGGADRASIFRAGLKLAETVPLQDLSIVSLARSMGITPALVHYYVGSRDLLTSGILNLFYKDTVRRWPAATSDWQHDVVLAAERLYEHLFAYPGVAAYLVQKNEYRVIQEVEEGETDYGLQFLECFARTIRGVGLTPERTGIYIHMMREFLFVTSYRAAYELFPSDQRKQLEKTISRLSPEQWPNVLYPQRALLQIDGDLVFREVIELFLLGMARDRGNARLSAIGSGPK
jgi:AcrR family transcriptional regulator